MKIIDLLEEKQTIIQILNRDCKQFLTELKGSSGFLYRGIKYPGFYDTLPIDDKDVSMVANIFKEESHPDRRPLHSNHSTHEILGRNLKKKFGWNPRSEHVLFGNGQRTETITYGHTHILFPIGEFKYVWSPIVFDVYASLNDNDATDVSIIDSYKDTDLHHAIASSNEIMINCKSAYGIHCKPNAEDYLESILL